MVGTKTRAFFKYFVVDAFTSSPLKGNPAVVFLLNEEKDTKSLQAMAQEFNLLTCYVTKLTPSKLSKTPRYNLRWFAPASEVKICGHGTIACTHAIFSTGTTQGNEIEFVTQSGVFSAKRISENGNQINGHELLRNDDFLEYQHKRCLIQLRFPLYPTVPLEPIEMKLVPVSLKGPSTLNIMKMSRENDLIDQVCGSIHCAVAPYWSKKLGKSDLKAYMASPRGGILMLHVDTETQSVLIAGEAVTVMEGSFVA
ncbi:uncharacterized protein LOC104904809 isoform X1 [Beta vulgaris subsp. vulgaris]|uniref:uncharacterized protein LOC104904809 isoform X1 n=1 Tax=Beta vulgaris subsp. vulgaris TaxID=3555 RepID=UPI002548ED70|nr:uncharacterized protein LOC104904809 isoform X1 [Beta vulgaris subsp. vulgaris]